MRRGRPIKYPRPADCPHLDRPEHANGVCYQCSSNINNQRKREKKLEEGSTPEPKRPRRRQGNGEYEELEYQDFVELNVGGKVFGTSIGTINREMSLISVLLSGQHAYSRYDRMGRLFIDRDPTYFRWILNYLRDGYLVTIPAEIHIRMQILQEARYYSLNSLSAIISNPHSTQQIHPHLQAVQAHNALVRAQQQAYQAYISSQRNDEQKQQLGIDEKKLGASKIETPSFLTARPSTTGIFYLSEAKWTSFFPSSNWSTVGVKFEDSADQISFLSISLALHQQAPGSYLPICQQTQEVARVPLQINEIATATINAQGTLIKADFWWEPSQSQYPQLCGKFTMYVSFGLCIKKLRDEVSLVGPLDFVQTDSQ